MKMKDKGALIKFDKIPSTGFLFAIKKIEMNWRIDGNKKNSTILGLKNSKYFGSRVREKKLYKTKPDIQDIIIPIIDDKKT